jgi:hypothetical protein
MEHVHSLPHEGTFRHFFLRSSIQGRTIKSRKSTRAAKSKKEHTRLWGDTVMQEGAQHRRLWLAGMCTAAMAIGSNAPAPADNQTWVGLEDMA